MFGMIGLLLGGSGAVLLNAKLDKSQPITIDGTVTSTSYDDEDDRTSVKCDWQNGTHDSSSMSGHVYTGTQVTKQQWKGALGFRWSTRPRIKR